MLSVKVKYALRSLAIMASNEGKTMQSKALAQQVDAPPKYLEAILTELSHHRIIDSRRGAFGGYHLARPAGDVTVGEVVRVLDGTIAPLRCASISEYRKCEDCHDEAACVVRRVMLDVRQSVAGVLDNCSLSDMLALSPKQAERVFW